MLLLSFRYDTSRVCHQDSCSVSTVDLQGHATTLVSADNDGRLADTCLGRGHQFLGLGPLRRLSDGIVVVCSAVAFSLAPD